MQINIQKGAKITQKMPISPITHHLPFVRNEFSNSAQNSGRETTLKPFGLRRLNKSAWALGPPTRGNFFYTRKIIFMSVIHIYVYIYIHE